MKTIKMDTEVTEWHIQRFIAEQFTTDEVVEFCRSLGFRMKDRDDQLEFWKKLRDECDRLLEK